jgi:uncharacterized protein DUF6176
MRKTMPTVLFVMPLKKGKTENYKAFLNECLGARRNEYEDLLRRYGLNIVKIWIHTLNDRNYAMFIHEMDEDAAKRLEGWSSSTHPFDQWFDKHLRDCYDIEDMNNMPIQPEFFDELDARK